MSTTVLVTGGTGFLGSYILKELIEKKYSVKALRRGKNLPHWIDASILEKVQWIEGDILDVIALEDAMEGVDAVIHSAAVVSFHKKDKGQMMQINIEGTANVVNIALEKNIQRLVHISSVAAIGRTTDNSLVDETKEWKDNTNNTNYAISKYKGELHVWRGMAEGLNAVILNPSTILGYGDWNSSSSALFKNTFNEFPWYSSGLNGFVAVEDVAKLAVHFLENEITENRYIINGDNWAFRKLMDTMAEGFGKRKPYKAVTPFLAKIAWRLEKLKSIFTGKKPLLTKETTKVAMSQTRFNNQKVLAALPDFQFTPLDVAVKKACALYLKDLKS